MSGIRSTLGRVNCKRRCTPSGWPRVLLLGCLSLLGHATWAAPVAIVQPAFYHQVGEAPVVGSTRTVIAYYDFDGEDLRPLSGEASRSADAGALEAARQLLPALRPEPVRDGNGVVVALRIRSRHPALSSILLLPETWNRFSRLLGPDCLAVVPNREVVLLFPRLGVNLSRFAVEVIQLYRNHPYPGSTEVLERRSDGLHAVRDLAGEFLD
jgi:hypothetical protein